MKSTCVICLISAITLAGGPAPGQEATRFDGIWRGSPTASCTYTGEDGGALKIETGTLYGVNATCEMADPVQVREMDATLYDMSCRGDGDVEWQDRPMLMQASDGGLYLVWDGIVYKYEGCDGQEVDGTVTRAEDLGITE